MKACGTVDGLAVESADDLAAWLVIWMAEKTANRWVASTARQMENSMEKKTEERWVVVRALLRAIY